jgi:uncharacterized protein (TIGR02147 family)
VKTIFDYTNYKAFLLDYFHQKRGNQSRLAEHLGCKPSFLTSVIDEKVEISLEHALKIPDFLGLNKTEKICFIFMVHKEKVSDTTGKKFFEDQIRKLKQDNKSIKERLSSPEEISTEVQARYYSSWIYGAVHILCAFKDVDTIDDIVQRLKADRNTISEIVEFLVLAGLIQRNNRKLSIGKGQIHIGSDSPLVNSHHTNWRLKAIDKFSQKRPDGTHFSSLIGISRKDYEKVEEILLKAVTDINNVVKDSGEEEAYVVNLDFFRL